MVRLSAASHRTDNKAVEIWGFTHRLYSSSFLGLRYRILNINHKKELLWSLWVRLSGASFKLEVSSGGCSLRAEVKLGSGIAGNSVTNLVLGP